jgi:hypothetical protein
MIVERPFLIICQLYTCPLLRKCRSGSRLTWFKVHFPLGMSGVRVGMVDPCVLCWAMGLLDANFIERLTYGNFYILIPSEKAP